MNWDQMEGEWKQRRGKTMRHWGKVMNDDLAAIAGHFEELVGKLQQRYGIVNEEASRQVKEFKKTIRHLEKSNSRLMQLQKSQLANRHVGREGAMTGKPLRTTLRSRSAG